MRYKTLEDIYPLTIVNRRFSGYAVIQADSDAICVGDLQWNEEWAYGDSAEREMEKGWDHICYGLGSSINEAFQDFLKRYDKQQKEEEERPKRDFDLHPLTPQEMELTKGMAKLFSPGIGFDLVPVQKLDLPPGLLFYMDPPSGVTYNS